MNKKIAKQTIEKVITQSPHILAESVVQAPCPDGAAVSVKDPIERTL